MTLATSEYLEHRLGQWQASGDMDALMRAADSLDLLSEGEHRAWEVDGDRAAALAAAIQAEIDTQKGDVFYGCDIFDMRYNDQASLDLMRQVLEGV